MDNLNFIRLMCQSLAIWLLLCLQVTAGYRYQSYYHSSSLPIVFPEYPVDRTGKGHDDFPSSSRSDSNFEGGASCKHTCLDTNVCVSLAGTAVGICGQTNKVCCQFEKKCNEVSDKISTTFSSPGYPSPIFGPMICQLDVIIQAGICAIKLDFIEFNLTNALDRGLCQVDQFLIMNTLEGPSYPRCGELTGYSTVVPVDARHRVPLTLLAIVQSSNEIYKYRVRVTQLLCGNTGRVSDFPDCGKRFLEQDGPENSLSEYDSAENEVSQDAESEKLTLGKKSIDNAFYVDYLKQAFQEMTSSTPNRTRCINTVTQVAAEEKSKLRSVELVPVDQDEWNDSSQRNQGRIIRGSDALKNEFPWQVSIQEGGAHICGGAIISDQLILTAAHCFLASTPVAVTTLRVVLGDLNINVTTETDHEYGEIKELTFHSHFDPYYLENDIAVLRLKEKIKFRPEIQPVCLPEADNSYVGKDATVSGWGSIYYPQGTLATRLKYVNTKVIENSECINTLKIDYIFPTMLCAKAPGCSGTCFGDSGGPLVVEKSGVNSLIGLVSFGIGGCSLFSDWPDVFTRVTAYHRWLSYAVEKTEFDLKS